MATDGQWRADLFAIVKNGSGQWIYNASSNLGFYPLGFVSVDGIERNPKVSNDPLEGLQALDPIRVDMQKRDKELSFTRWSATWSSTPSGLTSPCLAFWSAPAPRAPTSSANPATTFPSAGRC